MNWKNLLIAATLMLTACLKDDNSEPEFNFDQEFTFDFNEGLQGWRAGFADYPYGEEDFYELDFGHRNLPGPLDSTKKGFMITGNNHSDDLFMFLKRGVGGFLPDTTYEVYFEVELANNANGESVGAGGSPGTSVYLGAGALRNEPDVQLDEEEYVRMTIDKINQANDGEAMKVIGDVATERDDQEYGLITRNNEEKPIIVRTNNQGRAWIIVGTDSGFEGISTFYYTRIYTRFTITDSPGEEEE